MTASRTSHTPSRRPPADTGRVSIVTLAPQVAVAPAVSVTYAAPGCVLGHLRNMTFSAWNAPPTAEHVDAFIALAEQLSQNYPLNSNITLVMPDADLPETEARVALERLTSEYARVIHSVALVIDGTGFRASIIRSFLTGLHLLRGNGYRCKTFTKPVEANPWLLPPHNADTGVELSEREMADACDAIFARMTLQSAPSARRA